MGGTGESAGARENCYGFRLGLVLTVKKRDHAARWHNTSEARFEDCAPYASHWNLRGNGIGVERSMGNPGNGHGSTESRPTKKMEVLVPGRN